MKIAIITDTHAGVRSDNSYLKAKQEVFFREVFFPYLENNDIKVVLHLGDIFDKRKNVNFETLSWWNRVFMDRINELGIEAHFIVGNHDTYFKSSNQTNSLKELYSHSSYSNMNFYWDDPVDLKFEGMEICMCPWISPDNEERCLSFIEKTSAQVLMGHFQLVGFSMGRGRMSDHGYEPSIFSKFQSVLSGHFHTQSKSKNVHYLGTPYQMTWNDYGEKKGFHVLDTITHDLAFIENPHESFVKIGYEDVGMTATEISELDFTALKDSFVKVVVSDKGSPYIFDLFLDKLNDSSAADVKVIENDVNLDSISDEEIFSEAESTEAALQRYVENLEVDVDKSELSKFMLDLYREAIST